MNNPSYYMNTHTGSVDTAENWISEGADISGLVEVKLADGREVPEDFDPASSREFEWVEA